MYPAAHDRNQPCGAPPGHEILSFLARLREEPESDEGSSPDEGVPEKLAGHRGNGPPMMVGVGYVQREFCDGQSLASPGRPKLEFIHRPRLGLRYGNVSGASRLTMGPKSCWSISRWER